MLSSRASGQPSFVCIRALPVRKPRGAASSSVRSVRDAARGLEGALCALPGASLQLIPAALQLWKSGPESFCQPVPQPTHIQLLWGKEITPCSGTFSHLFLILDDELGAL